MSWVSAWAGQADSNGSVSHSPCHTTTNGLTQGQKPGWVDERRGRKKRTERVTRGQTVSLFADCEDFHVLKSVSDGDNMGGGRGYLTVVMSGITTGVFDLCVRVCA